jgi:hypothetical protein
MNLLLSFIVIYYLICCKTFQYFSLPAKATYAAIAKTYAYLTPDLWTETIFNSSSFQEHSDYLMKNHRPIGTQRQEAKAY